MIKKLQLIEFVQWDKLELIYILIKLHISTNTNSIFKIIELYSV